MNHAPDMNYPMLVGAGIQGARITMQGAQLRAPVTIQGFGRLFPEGSFNVPIPTLPPGVIQAVAATAAPATGTLSPRSKTLLTVGVIAAAGAVLALFLLR